MNYFYQQRKLKPKIRHPITFEDLSGKIKICIIENSHDSHCKTNATQKHFDGVVGESGVDDNVRQTTVRLDAPKSGTKKSVEVKATSSKNSLQKTFSKNIRKGSSFLKELTDILMEGDFRLSRVTEWSQMSYERLAKTVTMYDADETAVDGHSVGRAARTASSASRSSAKAERRTDKGRRGSAMTVNPEIKLNNAAIQFQLSSERFSEWLRDDNLQCTIASIEWCLTRLQCTLKKSNLVTAVVPEIVYYDSDSVPLAASSQPSPMPALFTSPLPKSSSSAGLASLVAQFEIMTEQLAHFNAIVKTTIADTRVVKMAVCGGTTSLCYPDGRVALLSVQTGEEDFLLVLNNDERHSLQSCFFAGNNADLSLNNGKNPISPTRIPAHNNNSSTTSGGGGWLGWPGLQLLVDSRSGVRQFGRDGRLTRQMRWPVNPNNKLPHSVHLHINEHLSFHCAGRTELVWRFQGPSGTGVSRPLEFAVHKWLFRYPTPALAGAVSSAQATAPIQTNTEQVSQISISSLASKSVSEHTKAGSGKSSKKEDLTVQFYDSSVLESYLESKREIIKRSIDSWIKFVRENLRIEPDPALRRAAQSAGSLGARNGHIKQNDRTKSYVSFKNYGDDSKLTKVQRPQTSALPLRSQSTKSSIHPLFQQAVCPQRVQQQMLSSRSRRPDYRYGSPESLQGFTECCCNKFQVPFITDVELQTFLRKVRPTQVVIVAVLSSRTLSAAEEGYVNRLHAVESSLVALITEVHVAETTASTQRPCVHYEHRPYRFVFYDVSSSGRPLNSTQSLLLRNHRIVPGMCLMFQNSKLLFADFIFNGYNSTKRDLFKQINTIKSYQETGFFLPDDYQLSFNNKSRQWMEENAYSRIQSFTPL